MRYIIILLTAVLCLSGCGQKSAERSIFAMDTVMDIRAYGDNASSAVDAAAEEIRNLERIFDRDDESSDIYRINTAQTCNVSSDCAYLLNRAAEISGLTDGSFDMTMAPIADLWGFHGQNYRVPSDEEIQSAMGQIGWEKVSQNGDTVTKPAETKLDAGGIAKGYASERAAEIFRDHGISSGMISLGGNVRAVGKRPDGKPWTVAVQDPRDISSYFCTVEVSNEAVVTSGGYQRYFEENGKRYHHILDPKTGRPADSGLISVTVVSSDGTLADGLSTGLFVMGKEKAAECWRSSRGFEMILVDEDGGIYITEGLEDRIESREPYSIIQR